ncbi:MAG: winged helix-turn-helix domain-containing protein [Pseudomonadota bacterium]
MTSKQSLHRRVSPAAPDCPSCGTTASDLFIGSWRLRLASRTLAACDSEINLPPRAFRVLLALLDARGDVVSRDALLDEGWPGVVVSDESLTQVISELRRAFARLGCQTKPIKTVSRAGYQLVADTVCDACKQPDGDNTEFAAGLDLEALGLCLEAKGIVARNGEAGMKNAALLTAEAARMAPGYAPAHAYKAVMQATLQLYRGDGGSTLRDAAEDANAAVRTNPRCAHAQAAMGYSLGALGRYDHAQSAYTRAIGLDPSNADIFHMAARTLFSARRYRLAATLAERAAALDPSCFYSLSLASRAAARFDHLRSQVYARRALIRVRETLRYDPEHARARGILGLSLAQLGHSDEAVEVVDDNRSCATSMQFPDVVTRCVLGLEDAAIESLKRAMDCGWRHAAWLYAEPSLAVLHKRREFRSIAARIAMA